MGYVCLVPILEACGIDMIFTTCGHVVHDMDDVIDAAIRGYTIEDERCIDYVALCRQCYTDYKTDGVVLYNESDKNKWLSIC